MGKIAGLHPAIFNETLGNLENQILVSKKWPESPQKHSKIQKKNIQLTQLIWQTYGENALQIVTVEVQ